MYVNPFLAGTVTTLLVEIVIILVVAIKRSTKKED